VNTALLLAGAVLPLAAGIAALAETRWRGLIRRELAEEVSLSIISPADREALASFGRFRKGWFDDFHERRTFRKLAGRLALVKARQRACGPERRRLLQVEILTLRTRLRKARQNRRTRESVPLADN
jgi:hypothetical protein